MKKKSRTAATNLSLFLIALPGILYLLINNYAPMLGIFLAFKNYSLMKGPFKSDWCGFDNFEFLFKTKDAWIMTRNTSPPGSLSGKRDNRGTPHKNLPAG